jgi:hypothetical protein
MTDSEFAVSGFELGVRNVALQMIGHPDTGVVTGLGLGPDLRVPVPFVLARRTGESARFVTLFEPYPAAGNTESERLDFSLEGEGCFAVRSARWTDAVCLSASGVTYQRK